MDYPGNLFVVSAPSGAGKSSLVKALRELDSLVQPSVSHTTRAPRGQEKHGREYFFASDQEFDALVAARARGAQLVGLCLGTYVLAYAGLLEGRRLANRVRLVATR